MDSDRDGTSSPIEEAIAPDNTVTTTTTTSTVTTRVLPIPASDATTIDTTAAAAAAVAVAATAGLSKNRQKKLAKRERARQKKLERKANEKARKRQQAMAEGRDLAAEARVREARTAAGDRQRRLDAVWDAKRDTAAAEGRFAVCIDLGGRCDDNHRSGNPNIRAAFEEAMREREVASLAQQIRYCYAYNKKSPNPVFATVTGLTLAREAAAPKQTTAADDFPTVREILERESGFREWSRRMFDCTEKTLEEYYGVPTAAAAEASVDEHNSKPTSSSSSKLSPPPRKKMVYLTSDSETTLERLEDHAVYVIGGIVDRNRLKRATIDRAERELVGVETARLPLSEYLRANDIAMATTKVLTVNHVFDILLRYREHGNDWDRAFREVLPRRKI